MLFSERLKMSKEYEKYLKENPQVADTPLTVITFVDGKYKHQLEEKDKEI